MNEITLKQSVKKKCLLLPFFVLFSLVISENIFALKNWTKAYVEASWSDIWNSFIIRIEIYDYYFRPGNVHGYLQWCNIDYSEDGVVYYKLTDILTVRQVRSKTTETNFRKKCDTAKIRFLDNVVYPIAELVCPNVANLKVTVNNFREYAKMTFAWHMGRDHNFHSIKISGKWCVDPPHSNYDFEGIKFMIPKPVRSKLNTPYINSNIFKNDSVNVFKDSEAIVIKGAELGENIKVFRVCLKMLNAQTIKNI